jgi:hypothetical protein
MSLTLDEYCNQVLPKKVLERRNNDQVYTRIRQKQIQSESCTNKREDKSELIAVGQAWIWNIENHYIVSPCHLSTSPSVLSGLRVGDPAIGILANLETEDRLRTIGYTLAYLVSSLDRSILWSVDDMSWEESLLNAFEKGITLVLEDVNRYADTVGVNKIKIEEERKYLHEISDILEELAMIKRVLLQQEDVWKTFATNAWPEYWPNGQDGRMIIPRADWIVFERAERVQWKTIIGAQSVFEKYRRRLSQLYEDAERVERTILIKLDLKQKHTSLQEAHSTAVMSAAVFGFAIVTIVFTPLSFVTSLFALPIDQFQQSMLDTDGTKTYSSSYISKWAGELPLL